MTPRIREFYRQRKKAVGLPVSEQKQTKTKKWKYCPYTDIYLGIGMQPPTYYISANNKKEALNKLVRYSGKSRMTLNMEGEIYPTGTFEQPKPIPVI